MSDAFMIRRQGAIQGYRYAVATLRTAQKTTKGAPAYSRYINRPLGRPLAALAYVLKMTPNQVTAVSAIFTFMGGSFAGEWLDHVVDAFKANLLHITVLLCWWQYYDLGAAWYFVPLCYTVASSVFFFSVILTDQLRRQARGTTSMFLQGEGHSSLLYSLAVMPTDYGLMIVVFGLIWWMQGFLFVYSALLVANILFLGMALPKWFREVRALAQS